MNYTQLKIIVKKLVLSIFVVDSKLSENFKIKNYQTEFYNLDAIIAVGYRVSSKKATKFRIWATDVLKNYIIKGFKIDVDRIKQDDREYISSMDELYKRYLEENKK